MISAVLNETKLTPAKSGHIPTQLLYLSVSCYLSIMWAFAFFSILYPEKNTRFPHGHPTTSRSGQFWTYQVDQLLDTIRLGSPSTPVGIVGCDLYTCLGTHV